MIAIQFSIIIGVNVRIRDPRAIYLICNFVMGYYIDYCSNDATVKFKENFREARSS